MTALEQYPRLEATGLWRATPDSQSREVVVSIGNATLVISTLTETALSHWSLPAVERLNPGQRPAIYGPDTSGDETLELEDDEIIAAIEKLRGVIERQRPHPGRLRNLIGLGAGVVLFLGAVLWLPDALLRQTVSLLPDAKRAQVGRDVLSEITRLTGRNCASPEGSVALGQLARRVFGAIDTPQIVVLRNAALESAHLPGNIIIINRNLVEDYENPEVLAGFLLAEDIRRETSAPMERLLSEAGLPATFVMLTTGDISDDHLHDHAANILTTDPAPVSDTALLERFGEVQIPAETYAYALDISGETTLPLIEGDPMRGQTHSPLMSDGSWIALQEICSE